MNETNITERKISDHLSTENGKTQLPLSVSDEVVIAIVHDLKEIILALIEKIYLQK